MSDCVSCKCFSHLTVWIDKDHSHQHLSNRTNISSFSPFKKKVGYDSTEEKKKKQYTDCMYNFTQNSSVYHSRSSVFQLQCIICFIEVICMLSLINEFNYIHSSVEES